MTKSILVRIYLEEEYEDVHPELCFADFQENPKLFHMELVSDERGNSSIEVSGGAYKDREGIRVERIGENLRITFWYDGGVSGDAELQMSSYEFLDRLGLLEKFRTIPFVTKGEKNG